VAEGGGLLNRYTLQRRIEGSNPSGSANRLFRSVLIVAMVRAPPRFNVRPLESKTEQKAAHWNQNRFRPLSNISGAFGGKAA
jgi:hypothetical protein